MHVSVELRHAIVEIVEQVIAENEGVRGAFNQLDLRRFDDHFRFCLHFDLARLHGELKKIVAVGIAQRDRLCIIIERKQ